VTIQLRYLQTLREMGSTQSSTIVFPLPMDLIGTLLPALGARADAPATARAVPAALKSGEGNGGRRLPSGEPDELGPALAKDPAARLPQPEPLPPRRPA
jgi:hypothetical protein